MLFDISIAGPLLSILMSADAGSGRAAATLHVPEFFFAAWENESEAEPARKRRKMPAPEKQGGIGVDDRLLGQTKQAGHATRSRAGTRRAGPDARRLGTSMSRTPLAAPPRLTPPSLRPGRDLGDRGQTQAQIAKLTHDHLLGTEP